MTGGTAVTLAARFALVSLNAILTVITSRGLGVVGRAIFAETSNAMYLAAAISHTGLGVANAYFAAGRAERGALVANTMVASVATFALSVVVVYVGRLTGLLTDDVTSALAIIAGVPLLTAIGLLNYVLLGSKRIIRYNAITVLQPVLLLCLYAVLLLVHRFEVSTAIVGLVVSQVPVLVLALAWLLRGVEPSRIRPSVALLRQCLAYAGAAQLGGLLVLANSRIGLYLVDPLAGRVEVGILSVALVIAEALSNLPQSLTVPLFSESAQVATDGAASTARAALVSRVGFLAVALLSVPLVAVTVIASPLVFGPEFQALPTAVVLLVPSIIATAPRLTSWTYLQSAGRPDLIVAPAAAGLAINVLLAVFLVPSFGANGACIAMSGSSVTMAAWLVHRHARLSRIPVRDLLAPRPADLLLALANLRALMRRTAG
jgi:O-antigen/teichoic acid export membrane protein